MHTNLRIYIKYILCFPISVNIFIYNSFIINFLSISMLFPLDIFRFRSSYRRKLPGLIKKVKITRKQICVRAFAINPKGKRSPGSRISSIWKQNSSIRQSRSIKWNERNISGFITIQIESRWKNSRSDELLKNGNIQGVPEISAIFHGGRESKQFSLCNLRSKVSGVPEN